MVRPRPLGVPARGAVQAPTDHAVRTGTFVHPPVAHPDAEQLVALDPRRASGEGQYRQQSAVGHRVHEPGSQVRRLMTQVPTRA